MHRIDHPTAAAVMPTPAAPGTPGFFTNGSPSTGVPATIPGADWANAIQEEIAAVVEAAAIPLDKDNNSQLLAAIVALITGGGTALSAEDIPIADAGGYFAGANVELALQQLGLSVLSGTVVASRLRRSIVSLVASAQTENAHAEAVVEMTNAADMNYTVRPDAALNLPIGTAIEIVQGGAGKVTFVAGAGVTIKRCALFELATLGQDGIAVLVKVAADTWRLGGMLEAA